LLGCVASIYDLYGEKPVVSKPVVSNNKPNFWQISQTII